MNNEHQFLITYGLHNFVSCARSGERRIFTICLKEGHKMARHATNLITGRYDENTEILVI